MRTPWAGARAWSRTSRASTARPTTRSRAYLRVSAGLRPKALDSDFQNLDAYAAAWRDALVKELRAYKAIADHCLSVVLDRRRDEARFLRRMKGAKTHPKARAHRAWRRNAERMARNLARSL